MSTASRIDYIIRKLDLLGLLEEETEMDIRETLETESPEILNFIQQRLAYKVKQHKENTLKGRIYQEPHAQSAEDYIMELIEDAHKHFAYTYFRPNPPTR